MKKRRKENKKDEGRQVTSFGRKMMPSKGIIRIAKLLKKKKKKKVAYYHGHIEINRNSIGVTEARDTEPCCAPPTRYRSQEREA